MDFLICKIKTRGTENIRLVLSDQTVYSNVIINSSYVYNDEYKLQENEWFCLDSFSNSPYFLEWMGPTFNAIDYEDISVEERAKISYLVSVQSEGNEYYFQRVLESGRMLDKKLINFSREISLQSFERIIVVNDVPDAIYKKDEDKLYFRDVGRIRPIFKGIESLYKEATEQEVESFLSIDFLQLSAGFDSSKVSVPNRRRIRLAKQQYDPFNDEQKNTLREYIRDYCPDLSLDPATQKYAISDDTKLKQFIYAVDQRYYSTPIYNQKRMATSVLLI